MTGYRGNWVDRGDPLETPLARVLAFALKRAAEDPAVIDAALTVRGIVEASGSEVDVVAHVRQVFETLATHTPEAEERHTLGIALWHIAKVGLVRDRALRRFAELSNQLPPERRLAEQLRDAILRAPEE